MTLLADTKGLSRGISDANSKLDGFGRTAKRAAGMAAVGFGAAAAAGVAWAKTSIQSLARIERINAQTANVIRSTGGAAGVTAKHVEDLAGRLEGLTASEAEATQEGANMLLTFTNIRNGVGKGNKIFDQATTTLVDMTRALGSDPQKQAVQLGKALNDPIKGVAALSKVGVSFTEDQKKVIKSLVESGDTMGAQKVILAELTKEFGGSGKAFAKTATGQVELAKHAFGTLGETIFSTLLPPLARVATAAIGVLTVLNDKYGQRIADTFTAAGSAIRNLMDRLSPVADWFKSNPELIKGAAIALGIAAVAAGALAIGMGALAVATSPITLTVLAIAALGAGIAYAYKNSESFRSGVNKLVNAFKAFGKAALPVVMDVFESMKRLWTEVQPKVMAAVQSIASIFGSAMAIVSSVVTKAVGVMTWVWNTFGANILQFLNSTFANVMTVLQGAFQVIQGIFQVVLGVIRGDWGKAWAGIKNIVAGVWKVITGLIKQAFNVIRFVIKNGWTIVKTITSGAWNGIKNVLGKAWDGIKSLMSKAWDALKNTARTKIASLVTVVKTIPQKLKNALSGATSFLTETGKDVVRGMWEGIQSMGGWLADKVWDWVKSVLPGPVEKALGINSPSRVFKEIGQYTVAGLAMGITDARQNKRLSAAAARMTDNLSISPHASYNSRTAAYSGSTAAPVVVHNHFEVPVFYDKRELGRIVTEAQKAYQGVGGARVA